MCNFGFNDPLKFLLWAVLDQIDDVCLSFVIETLRYKSGVSDRKLKKVIKLLLQAGLFDDDVLLVCLGLLDDIKIKDGMAAFHSFDRFF